MRRILLITTLALAGCGSRKLATPEPARPLDVVTTPVELPSDLGELRFATTSADGEVVGLMFASQVVVVRDGSVEAREGALVPGTSPLIGHTEGDEVHFDELVEGTEYRAPVQIGAAIGGGWNELWRLAPGKPGGGLLRAVTNRERTWSAVDFHTAGEVMPRWHVELVPGGKPALVADAALSHDASLALVQLSGNDAGRLVAYETVTGTEAWAVDTSATYGDRGALLLSDDGKTVTTLLADPSRCKTCAKIEVREVATGAKVSRLQLDPAAEILARLGQRGVETTLGLAGDELWVRSRHAGACTYEAVELAEGAVRRTVEPWKTSFADCANVLLALPIQGGVLGVRVVDAQHVELLRFDHAP
jgi:hypothetical protein